jgi:hypothetical protein
MSSPRASLSYGARREVLAQIAPRYQQATHAQKTLMLDQIVKLTGYARKYVIQLLNHVPESATRILRLRSPLSGSAVQEALFLAWRTIQYPCAQLRTDLAEAECGLEEAQVAGLVLATRHLERAMTEVKMRIAALEVSDDRPHRTSKRYNQLVEQYLGLESMEVTETLLDICGATIDERALPLLKQRLQEEQAQIPKLEMRGYIRLREKGEQIVAALTPLIAALEAASSEEQKR